MAEVKRRRGLLLDMPPAEPDSRAFAALLRLAAARKKVPGVLPPGLVTRACAGMRRSRPDRRWRHGRAGYRVRPWRLFGYRVRPRLRTGPCCAARLQGRVHKWRLRGGLGGNRRH